MTKTQNRLIKLTLINPARKHWHFWIRSNRRRAPSTRL